MKTHAQIECPSCSELTDVEGEDFVCDKCRSSLSGYIYKKHKQSISTTIKNSVIGVSLVTGGLYVGFDKVLDTQYPMGYEYYIVSACVGLDNSPLDLASYKEKQKICVCAYEKASSPYGMKWNTGQTQQIITTFPVFRCASYGLHFEHT